MIRFKKGGGNKIEGFGKAIHLFQTMFVKDFLSTPETLQMKAVPLSVH